MSAELLREAAALMRERAEAATPGPWRVGAEGSEGSRVNPNTGDKREDSHWIASVNGRVQPEDGCNAQHIASWHPAVALAVADWLEGVGKIAARNMQRMVAIYGAEHGPKFVADIPPDALAVARAYLGRDA